MNVYTEKRDCQYEVDMYNTIRIKQSYITLTFNPWLLTSMDVNIQRGLNPSRISSGAGAPKKLRAETTISICHFDFFGLGRPSPLQIHFLQCLVVFTRNHINILILPINYDKIQAGKRSQKK